MVVEPVETMLGHPRLVLLDSRGPTAHYVVPASLLEHVVEIKLVDAIVLQSCLEDYSPFVLSVFYDVARAVFVSETRLLEALAYELGGDESTRLLTGFVVFVRQSQIRGGTVVALNLEFGSLNNNRPWGFSNPECCRCMGTSRITVKYVRGWIFTCQRCQQQHTMTSPPAGILAVMDAPQRFQHMYWRPWPCDKLRWGST